MASADQGTPEEVVLELTPLNGPSKAKNTKATNAPSRQTGTTPQQAFAGAVALKVKAQQLKRRADKLQVQKVQRPGDHLTTMRSLKKKMNPTKSYSPWVEGIDGIAPNSPLRRFDVVLSGALHVPDRPVVCVLGERKAGVYKFWLWINA
jgi:hypothetical protein